MDVVIRLLPFYFLHDGCTLCIYTFPFDICRANLLTSGASVIFTTVTVPVSPTYPVDVILGCWWKHVPLPWNHLKWMTFHLGILFVLLSGNSWLPQSKGWVNITVVVLGRKNQRQAFQIALPIPPHKSDEPKCSQTSKALVSYGSRLWGMLTSLSKWCFAGSWTAAPHWLGSSSDTVRTTLQYCPPLGCILESHGELSDTPVRGPPLLQMLILISRGRKPGHRHFWGSLGDSTVQPWLAPLPCRKCHSDGVFVILWVRLVVPAWLSFPP